MEESLALGSWPFVGGGFFVFSFRFEVDFVNFLGVDIWIQ